MENTPLGGKRKLRSLFDDDDFGNLFGDNPPKRKNSPFLQMNNRIPPLTHQVTEQSTPELHKKQATIIDSLFDGDVFSKKSSVNFFGKSNKFLSCEAEAEPIRGLK